MYRTSKLTDLLELLAGSAGEIAGVVSGDMLIELDGIPVMSLPGASIDLVQAIVEFLSSRTVTAALLSYQ